MKDLKHTKTTDLHPYPIHLVIGLVCMIFVTTAFSQNTQKLADTYIEKYLEHVNDADLYQKLKEKPEKEVLEAFGNRLNDTLGQVRRIALRSIAGFGNKSTNQDIRQQAVKYMVDGLKDEEAGTINIAAEYLTEFLPRDFTAESKYNISMRVKENPPHLYKIILLTGWLNIEDLIYDYKQMQVQNDSYDKRERWCMKLAMARMGDNDAIKSVLEDLKKLPVNDDVVYEIYPYMAYTRQKEIFDFLMDKIMSDSKDCLSANPDKEVPVICAYRIMNYAGPYIADFPLKTDATGELIIDDYSRDLAEVRNWITEHKNDYELIKEIY